MSIKTHQVLADQLLIDNASLHNMYLEIENMINCVWDLPSGLNTSGVHKVVITDAYDAMNALRRILSKQQPKINIHPIAPNAETKARTDMMERGLSWMYKQTSRRRATDLTGDLAWSAGAYGQVIGQVSYIPDEIKAREAFKGQTDRLQAAYQDSPFYIELHNPRSAFAQRSSYGIEGVATRKVIRLVEAMQFWGDYASGLARAYKKLSDEERYKAYVTIFDVWENRHRSVWGVIRNDMSPAKPLDDSIIIIDNEEHGKKFFPWFHRMTGNGLESSVRNQVMPMLKAVVDSGLYETQNSLETMIMSKAIKLFGRPTLKEEGPNPASTEIDYTADELGQTAKVPAGNTLQELRQDVLDTALLEMANRGAGRMDKATVSRLLQTGEFPAQTAASAINIITQSAVESIGPFKRCAEQAIEDICAIELKAIHYSQRPLVVDGAAAVGQPQVVIDPNDINPDYVYVDVEITAVAPTDQVARANAGQMLMQMGYPVEKVFEQIGETDGTSAMKQAMKEQLVNKLFAARLADIDLAVQQKAAMAQMQIQQAAQQQMAAGNGNQISSTPPTGLEGQGNNMNAGAEASGATYEQQRGQTRDGTPL